MANKNKGKVIQMLSPENYIRKKARTLPIHECWINQDWKDAGVASIIISRKHINGNITFCLYLVDLYLLGVKESFFKFNVPEFEFREFIDKVAENMVMETTEYVLVHNIILAGVEYAEEYGFKPYKDYTSITQFMLEEDTDQIELIEIECGKEGKPLFLQGPYESDASANKIVKQLEHTAGKGNFHFVMNADSDFEDGFEEDYDEFEDLTLDEKGERFMQGLDDFMKLNEDEVDEFFSLLQSIIDDLINIELHNTYYDEFLVELTKIKIDNKKLPNELLGVEKDKPQVTEDIAKAFLSIVYGNGTITDMKKQFKTFKKYKGIAAAVDYLEVVFSAIDRPDKPEQYRSMLEKTSLKHPNYTVLQLKLTKNQITASDQIELVPHYPFKLENFFGGRDYIHSFEYFCYLDTFIHSVIAKRDFTKLEALKTVIFDLEIPEEDRGILSAAINMVQMEVVESYFEELKEQN